LIEKSRTVVSDASGQYKLIDLTPGVYTVTFTLSGFTTVKREGIELSTNFSAPVNAELKPGSVEESVVVSGQSPIVDVQNVVKSNVVSKEAMDSLPTAKSWSQMGVLTVGVTSSLQDVGGSAGDNQNPMAAHGGAQGDKIIEMDGGRMGLLLGSYSSTGLIANDASTQEVSYEIGSISAETQGGGVRVNIIPKEGGNRFSGSGFASYVNNSMTWDNFSADLAALKVTKPDAIYRLWDLSGSLGGPILKDKLWFFQADKWEGNEKLRTDTYWEVLPTDPRYLPNKFVADTTRQAIDDQWVKSFNLRMTYQISQRQKMSVYYDNEPRCTCTWGVGPTLPPEASRVQRLPLNYHTSITYTAPLSNKLLISGGVILLGGMWTSIQKLDGVPIDPRTGLPVSVGYSITDSGYGYTMRALTTWSRNFSATHTYRGSASYVTGSHAMKLGFGWINGPARVETTTGGPNDMNLNFLNGVPKFVTVRTTPYTTRNHLDADLGIYAQDVWTLNRLTLSYGLRLDMMKQSVEAQDQLPGTWIGVRHTDAIENVPNWKDLNPRVGLSYDVFGNGKTAVKASINRYNAVENIDIASSQNPVGTTVNTTTRVWQDLNTDFLPQSTPGCAYPSIGCELGPLASSAFGQQNVTSRYADGALEGWFKRRYNWEISAGVTHAVTQRIAVDFTYYHRTQGNFTASDDLNHDPDDYDPFCVTAPNDPRLPNGGGYQVCGLYDQNVTKVPFSTPANTVVSINNPIQKQTQIWQGVDLVINARFGKGGFFSGGFDTGKSDISDCGFLNKPSQYCAYVTPFLTQYKANLSYPLPWWGIQGSVALQSLPPNQISATRTYTNAEIVAVPTDQGGLGRNLAAGTGGTYSVSLIPTGTVYSDRLNQLDLRGSKIFKLGGAKRLQVNVDLYNSLNVSTPLGRNTAFGDNWLKPTSMEVGRFVKFGAQFNF
jgi:hypothetical protein